MSAPDVIDVDPVPAVAHPTEVALATSAVPAEYQARVVMSAEDARAQAEAITAMTQAVLKPNVHYGVIPGTSKPSLYKPGAEWLLKVYGFGHHMTAEDTERVDGKPYGVTYRCHVTKLLADGRVIEVATCDGYAGRDETKWEKAPWNTVIKMAQKRALVGACLQATGTSGMFTQDVEDYAASADEDTPPARPDAENPWADVIGNPAGWYDNRSSKKNPNGPDFKAKPANGPWSKSGEDRDGNPGPHALWLGSAPVGFIEALAIRDTDGVDAALALLEAPETTGRGSTVAGAIEALSIRELHDALTAAGLDTSGSKAQMVERLRAAEGSSDEPS